MPRSCSAAPIYNSNVGGPSSSAGNRRFRRTESLSANQANGVIEAARHAGRIGLPFNRHVTIRLERAGIADSEAIEAIGAFLTRIRDWLRKQGHQTAFAWVRENGSMIGSHVHILVHIPPEVRLGHRSRRWIEAISGKRYRANSIRTKSISSKAYNENLGVLIGYLCKGASAEVAEKLGLDRRKPGGSITGKRAGWSQNVGKSARLRWSAPKG